jgi:hypothetical protein
MQNHIYTWKKKFFGSKYQIFGAQQTTGELKERAFSQNSYGHLNEKKYTFLTKGFWKQTTHIMDSSKEEKIGEINYSGWMTRATIKLNSKEYFWQYDNMWNTKWRIFDHEGTLVQYSGSSTGGQIFSNTDNEPLLLSGLFVTNYYWQITAVIIIIIIFPLLFR